MFLAFFLTLLHYITLLLLFLYFYLELVSDDNTVIVKLEKICDGCRAIDGKTDSVPLFNFLDKLNLAEQREALIHLSLKWADSKGGGIHE